jgi:hypothetical protein
MDLAFGHHREQLIDLFACDGEGSAVNSPFAGVSKMLTMN